MKHLSILSLLFLFFFSSNANTYATMYYISPNGSDIAQCTKDNPCKSISQTSLHTLPGDTIFIRGGTYLGQGSSWFNNVLKNPKPGTKNNPIIIKSYPGEKVIFDGLGTVDALFDFCSETDRWIVVDGLEITNYLKVGLWIKAKAEGITIQNCNFHDIVKEQAIYIADYEKGALGAENITIQNNTLDGGGNYASGIHCNHGSVAVSGLKIYNNIIKNYKYAAILIGAGSENIRIYNNTFYNNDIHTLQLDYQGDIDIDNSWGDGGTWVEQYAAKGLRNCIVKNNIIYGDGSGTGLRIGINNMLDVITANNLFYNLWPSMIQFGSDTVELSAYQNISSNGDNSLVENPLFIDPVHADFHLQPGSHAIDAGTIVPIRYDHQGEPRLQNKSCDIGAFENPRAVNEGVLQLLRPSIFKLKKSLLKLISTFFPPNAANNLTKIDANKKLSFN